MKEKEKKSSGSIFWLLIMVVLLLIIAFGVTLLTKGKDSDNIGATEAFKSESSISQQTEDENTQPDTTEPETTESNNSPRELNNIEIYSETAFLINSNGDEVYSKNSDERIYPASLTKIMTAIVAIENINYLDESVVIPGDIFEYIENEGASTAGFSAYENVTYKDLLYGTLLSSGAECCLTLASYIGGSEEMFVQMMNEKAQELEMENTHFTNVSGLHNYDHYSTAEDIAKLLTYALQNDEFREIFTSPSYYTETDYQPSGVTLNSTMFSELDSESFNGGVFLGGKTGYTSEAGLCLASLARVNGEEYILVTTGAEGTHYTEPFHIYDAITVYEALSGNSSENSYVNSYEDSYENSYDSSSESSMAEYY